MQEVGVRWISSQPVDDEPAVREWWMSGDVGAL
jgi:hypothetical protein